MLCGLTSTSISAAMVAIFFTLPSAWAKEAEVTAGAMLPFCKEAQAGKTDMGPAAVACVAVVSTLAYAAYLMKKEYAFCVPPVPPTALAATVATFIEKHPDSRDQKFVFIATVALKSAFPCK